MSDERTDAPAPIDLRGVQYHNTKTGETFEWDGAHWTPVPAPPDQQEAIRRAQLLECAEMAEREAASYEKLIGPADYETQYVQIKRIADALRALAASYRQMAEGNGG